MRLSPCSPGPRTSSSVRTRKVCAFPSKPSASPNLSAPIDQDPLTQMTERRMAKIMSRRGRLYHGMIKTAKIMKEFVILSAE